MKFKFGIVLLILIATVSCTKKTVLETTFNCSSSLSFSETKKMKDVKKNFTMIVPTNWRTQLYYDEFQSDIFTADTTKQLSETYILDASWKLGELKLDTEFKNEVTSSTDLTIISSEFEDIQNKPAFWYVSKGKKNNFDYQVLNIYIKTSVDTYLEINTEVYGNENVEKRLCESINIIKTIEFI